MIYFFEFRLPWDQNTVIGGIAEMIISFSTGFFYMFINATFLTFFISIGEFHQAFSEHYCNAVKVMKELAADVQMTFKKTGEIKGMFLNLIQFHVRVKG